MTTTTDLHDFDDRITELLVRPGADGWDQARAAWNLTVDQRPSAVAFPETPQDVQALVRYARAHGLRLAPQGTGHNAGAVATLERTILLKTTRMRQVHIDPHRRIARVGAGVLWDEVVTAAHKYGLAALSGSSPDVGVVGYTLGGGLSWLARSHGLSCNSVHAIEAVTADGRLVRATAEEEPELFWALRGGGGSFAIVTAMELVLLPLTEVHAGALLWPIEQASAVLHAWRDLTATLPETMTSVARLLQMPPIPDVPEPMRGRSFVVVEAIFLGEEVEGRRLLAPLLALEPEIDTLAVIPPAELVRLHMDPEQPVPGIAEGWVLTDLPAAAVDALLTVAGPDTASPLLAVDIRHIGGAARRPAEGHGALAGIDGDFAVFGVGLPMTPELGVAQHHRIAQLAAVVQPWAATSNYLNFVEHPVDTAGLFPADTYARLRAVRRHYDPDELLVANHPIPPAA